jgi:hypothetical protein
VLDGVVPGLLARRAEEERRARVAQRLQKQMGAVLLDAEGGFGRYRTLENPRNKLNSLSFQKSCFSSLFWHGMASACSWAGRDAGCTACMQQGRCG